MAYMKFREGNRARWVGVRPGHDGEQVWDGAGFDNATVTVYTVPAGKRFFFTGYSFEYSTVGVNQWCSMTLRDPGGVFVRYLQRYFGQTSTSFGVTQSFWPPLEIDAGYYIDASSSAASVYVTCDVHGWIEDV